MGKIFTPTHREGCEIAAEANIMYGAWRQLCIAQSAGVPYTVNEVFQRPAI